MAKYDEEDWKKNGRGPQINDNEEPELNVAMLSPLIEREIILEETNSGERVVSNPVVNKLAPGMSIVAENGGFEQEEKNSAQTTRSRSKSGKSRQIGER